MQTHQLKFSDNRRRQETSEVFSTGEEAQRSARHAPPTPFKDARGERRSFNVEASLTGSRRADPLELKHICCACLPRNAEKIALIKIFKLKK